MSAMTQPPPRVPTSLQPRPKAAATNASSVPISTATSSTASTPPISKATADVRRQGKTAPLTDAASDKAVAALIRRTLCAHQLHGSNDKGWANARPIDELLPPLTSSNDVDLQLYGFIAIVMRDFVYAWYRQITPDHLFVDEVVQIIAHCTRALEQRLRKVDLESLLLDEIPELIEAHIITYRASHYPLHLPPLASNPRQTYHALHPHPALSPAPVASSPDTIAEQQENEAAYRRLLVDGVLAVLLPTEDLENCCLRTLVREIVGQLILGNALGGKGCEGWILWEGITKVAESFNREIDGTGPGRDCSDDQLEGPKDGHSRLSKERGGVWSRTTGGVSIADIAWRVLHYAYLAFTVLRFVVIALATSSSLPSRTVTSRNPSIYGSVEVSQPPLISLGTPLKSPIQKRPILGMKIWSCVSLLLGLDAIMPWLKGTFELLQWGVISGPGRVGDTNGILDRILSSAIHSHILQQPGLLASTLRQASTLLFPHNNASPPLTRLVPPDPLEIAAMKRRCARAVLSAIPAPIRRQYLGDYNHIHSIVGGADGVRHAQDNEATALAFVEEILDVFGDTYCNRHLLYSIVDLVMLRLVPELATQRPSVLLKRRVGIGEDGVE